MPSKLKPWLLLVLVFLAGIGAGVVGTRAFVWRVAHNRPGDWIAARMENELISELALTPDQQTKVHQVVQDSQKELQKLREELGPRFGGVFARAEKQIALILTPEQQAKYEQFLKERKARWPSPGGPGKNPPGGRPHFGDRDREHPFSRGTNSGQ